jgi:hypothetical protein
LEHKYGLTCGIKPSEHEKIINKIIELLNLPNRREVFQYRRNKMLAEKIDVTAFLTWFVNEYPASVDVLKKNPDYQNNFR